MLELNNTEYNIQRCSMNKDNLQNKIAELEKDLAEWNKLENSTGKAEGYQAWVGLMKKIKKGKSQTKRQLKRCREKTAK